MSDEDATRILARILGVSVRTVYSKGDGWENNLPHFKSGVLTDGSFHSKVSDIGVDLPPIMGEGLDTPG